MPQRSLVYPSRRRATLDRDLAPGLQPGEAPPVAGRPAPRGVRDAAGAPAASGGFRSRSGYDSSTAGTHIVGARKKGSGHGGKGPLWGSGGIRDPRLPPAQWRPGSHGTQRAPGACGRTGAGREHAAWDPSPTPRFGGPQGCPLTLRSGVQEAPRPRSARGWKAPGPGLGSPRTQALCHARGVSGNSSLPCRLVRQSHHPHSLHT